MLAGIELADTVTIDGHKQMHLPIGTSMLRFRGPALASVIEKRPNYMLQDGSGDLGCRSLEGSRDGASIFVHAALSIIGTSGYKVLVEAGFSAARRMAESIRHRPAFHLVLEPETNIVLYRFLPLAYRARPDSLDARAKKRVNRIRGGAHSGFTNDNQEAFFGRGRADCRLARRNEQSASPASRYPRAVG
jgi:glutamate/tyrosine decarboxylase-like PLP-dependent enzyme